jgi:PmbA protein
MTGQRTPGRDLVGLCKRAVKEALRLGVQAEAFASMAWEVETEIDGSNITIGTESMDFGVGIRVLSDKKIGFAYTSVPKDIPRTVRFALSASRLGVKVDYDFPSKCALPQVKGLIHEEVLNLETEQGFKFTKEILDGAKSVNEKVHVPSGGLYYGIERFAIVNTMGLETDHVGTVYSVSANAVIGEENKTSAYDSRTSRALDIDAFEVGKKAADLAVRLQGGRSLKGGKMDVVFTPPAMAELFGHTLVPAFFGDRVATGESYLKGRLGKRVAVKGLCIEDDGLRPSGLGSARCDEEGSPSRRNVVLKDGILKGYLYDVASAAKYGERNKDRKIPGSTGNGLRPGFRGVPSSGPRNVMIEGRTKAVDKIIASIDNGVLVHDIMGAHTANPASTDFSIQSSVLFKIEKGQIAYPVQSAMISGNLAEMMMRIGALGDDVQGVAGGTAYYIPSFWFKNVQVTG